MRSTIASKYLKGVVKVEVNMRTNRYLLIIKVRLRDTHRNDRCGVSESMQPRKTYLTHIKTEIYVKKSLM